MAFRVTAIGKTVEELCFDWLKQETGDHDRASRMAAGGFVEATLALNPGLAALQAESDDSVPVGTIIVLPPLPDDSIRETIKLW